jgi:hypothetical protein
MSASGRFANKSKRFVTAVNRTRGSCMASTNFTTKPLRLIYEAYPATIKHNSFLPSLDVAVSGTLRHIAGLGNQGYCTMNKYT